MSKKNKDKSAKSSKPQAASVMAEALKTAGIVAAQIIAARRSRTPWQTWHLRQPKPRSRPPPPPNPNHASASPTPGSRWTNDPSAIPGEPELYLDWTEENEPKAVIKLLEIPDEPDHELYAACLGNGLANGDTLGVYDDLASGQPGVDDGLTSPRMVRKVPSCMAPATRSRDINRLTGKV